MGKLADENCSRAFVITVDVLANYVVKCQFIEAPTTFEFNGKLLYDLLIDRLKPGEQTATFLKTHRAR